MPIKKQLILLGLTIAGIIAYGSFINPMASTMLASVGFLALCFLIFFQVARILIIVSTSKVSTAKINIFSAITAFIPTYLMALTSLSSLKVIDIFFTLTTCLVVIWYTNRVVK